MKSFCHKIILPKFHPHRSPRSPRLCASQFCPLIAAVCLLSAVLCQPSWAGGSWIVDGQAVQTLEVQTTNTDPGALYTDGTRAMQAPLVFAPELSSPTSGLFKATLPWDGEYDFFTFDENEEAVHLCSSQNLTFYPTPDIFISNGSVWYNGVGGLKLDELTLSGEWMIDAVGPYDECVISRGFADNRYVRPESIGEPLVFNQSVSSPTNGLLRAWFDPEGSYIDLLVLDGDEEVLWLASSLNVAVRLGDTYISSSSIQNISVGTKIGFEDQMLEGGWMIDSVMDNNYAILNRAYADTRYIKRTEGITTNHTFQAGDVLQIQNGIITAINP